MSQSVIKSGGKFIKCLPAARSRDYIIPGAGKCFLNDFTGDGFVVDYQDLYHGSTALKYMYLVDYHPLFQLQYD